MAEGGSSKPRRVGGSFQSSRLLHSRRQSPEIISVDGGADGAGDMARTRDGGVCDWATGRSSRTEDEHGQERGENCVIHTIYVLYQN